MSQGKLHKTLRLQKSLPFPFQAESGQSKCQKYHKEKSLGFIPLFQRTEPNAALHRIVSIHLCHSCEHVRATQECLGAGCSVGTHTVITEMRQSSPRSSSCN